MRKEGTLRVGKGKVSLSLERNSDVAARRRKQMTLLLHTLDGKEGRVIQRGAEVEKMEEKVEVGERPGERKAAQYAGKEVKAQG